MWSPSAGELGSARTVACDIHEGEAAATLLRPFRLEDLIARHAKRLGRLAQRYGAEWFGRLVDVWTPAQERRVVVNNRLQAPARRNWVTTVFVPLCRELPSDSASNVATALTDRLISWAESQIATVMATRHARKQREQLAGLGPVLAALLTAAPEKRAQAAVMRLDGDDGPVTRLELATLRARLTGDAGCARGGNDGSENGLAGQDSSAHPTGTFARLADDARTRLERLLARPARERDDWSIVWTGCGCADCQTFEEFLRDHERHDFTWPLAKPRRRHIHSLIDASDLPLQHETRHQGSPHKLMLHKTKRLFTDENTARKLWQEASQWLKANG